MEKFSDDNSIASRGLVVETVITSVLHTQDLCFDPGRGHERVGLSFVASITMWLGSTLTLFFEYISTKLK